jgi:serine protease Do
MLQIGTPRAEARELPDFTDLVERAGPSVVNIRTAERVRGPQAMPEADEQMQELLRRFGIPLPNQRRGAPRGDDDAPQRRGVGSGFILSSDGYVMTNAHVVDGADEVTVTLTDKREFKAKLIGTDARTDVAVLKIDASGLSAVRIGDVGRLRVGEWVLAIGSPFGFDSTVTSGIVSAKARDTGELLPFVQTDVAINPGNSGGPLLNMRGEVVGINSQIYSRSGGFMGISFAIPIDEAMRVAEQLRGTGRVTRGRIGVLPDDLSKEVAEAIGLGRPSGALVRSVVDGGPSEKAGVEPGDVITRFDGKPVDRASELRRLVAATKHGSKVAMQVFRRGGVKELVVTVAELSEERPRTATESGAPQPATVQTGALGLTVAELSDASRRELRVRGGARVTAAEGPSARAGLREGDVVLSVNNQEVSGAKQLQNLLPGLEKGGKPVSLLVRRDGAVSFVLLRSQR